MTDLTNIQVAWITAGAALVASLLTGLLVFLIEKYKSSKAFKENQDGILSLLANDVFRTTDSLNAMLDTMQKRLGDRSNTAYKEIIRQLLMLLNNANNLAVPAVINNFKYLPPLVRKYFVVYYRHMEDLIKLCDYIEGHRASLDMRYYTIKVSGMLCHLLSSAHIVLAEIADYEKNVDRVKSHRNKSIEYMKASKEITE